MRDFLKQILATVVGLALFTAMSVGGLAALLFSVAFFSRDTAPDIESGTMLTFNLSQPISDGQGDEGNVLSEAISGNRSPQTMPLRTVLTTLERAAKDERIAGLYLSGNISSAGLGSGYATLREIRQALQEFRDAGKPIVAYDDTGWSERGYYLASVADQIFLNPSGQLEINGFNFETTLYGGALQKYGIGVQPLRVGKYKSAVEPFVRTSISPENRAETQKLLADLWNEFLTTTAQSRKVTPQQLQTIADQQGILLPEQAQAAKLVDRLAYDDEVLTELQKITDEPEEDSFRQIDIEDYAEATAGKDRQQGDQIAIVYAEGNIVSGRGGAGTIGGDRLASTLRQVRQDEDIKAVVLRINSPGGSATASDLIAREVLLLKKEKPVIVSMGSYAASGGYQIAANANQIFASPTTITGSIGVFGVLPNFQRLANANGITWDTVKTGRLADLDTISRPKNPEELRILQGVANRLYDRFLTMVSTSRSMPKQRVEEIAQGRVWSGAEAARIGLVDEIGGIEDAIQAAAKEAKLGDTWQIEEYPRQRSFEERILSQFTSRILTEVLPPAETLTDPLSVKVQQIREDWETLRSLNDPLGMYSRLPFTPLID
jgi:protease-4